MKAEILIVSQDPERIKEITNSLEKEGHKLSSTNDAEVCLGRCKAEPIDLIFIDTNTPALPYSRLISDIKKITPETEIIAITSYAFPEAMIKAETQDVNSFLILPLTAEKIKIITNRALRQGELIRENRRLLLAITAAKKEWEATVDAIEDSIFVTDFDYNILRANLATFRKLGKGVNEIVGHKCYKIFHRTDKPPSDCPGKRARDSGEPNTEAILFKGLRQRLTCSVYPQVFAAGGGLVHYLREPLITTEYHAEMMAKYERLFDDANIPVLLVSLEDYKIVDANQKALELMGREPEKILNADVEDLFAGSMSEATMGGLIKQLQENKGALKSKILDNNNNEIDIYVLANTIEIGANRIAEIFLIPFDLLQQNSQGSSPL